MKKKKWKRRALTVITAGLLIAGGISAAPAFATQTEESGTQPTYKLSADGVLTVSGSGTFALDSEWENADKVKELIFDGGPIVIGKGACDFPNLTTVQMNQAVTRLGYGAFYDCKNLKEVVIPASVTCLDGNAFGECTGLEKVHFQGDLSTTGERSFSACDSLSEIKFSGSVEEIGARAFSSCPALKNVVLPEGLVTVREDAFWNCRQLESIFFPGTLKRFAPLGKNYGVTIDGFAYGTLKAINVAENNEIYSSADGVLFNKDRTELLWHPASKEGAEYRIPQSVTQIGRGAFDSCGNLKSIILPERLTDIKGYAFYDCRSLQNIDFPQNLKTIGEYAFTSCSSLEKIVIPDSVLEIGSGAFRDCSSLGSLLFSKSITAIQDATCYGCIALDNVIVPDGVTVIGKLAFSNCDSLKNIMLSQNLRTLGDAALQNCISIQSVELPSSVETIGSLTFGNCRKLGKIILSESLKSIGVSAFMDTKLKVIDIPVSVNAIDSFAFDSCRNLICMIVRNPECSLGEEDASQRQIAPLETIVYGFSDSTAQHYAGKYGNQFVSIDSGIIEKLPQTITAASHINKVYGDGMFNLEAIVDGDGTLSYRSDNSNVAFVDSQGNVTLKGVGETVITITASATEIFQQAVKEVVVTVSAEQKPGGNDNENTTPEPEEPPVIQKPQTITGAKAFTKTYGSKAFYLGATAKTPLSYRSDNNKVATVNSVGRVTIKGTGKVTITVKAAATDAYKAATKRVIITVKPKQAVLTKASSGTKKTLTAVWKKDTGATGYQVMLAQNSKFTKGKKVVTVSKNKTVKTTVKKLKSKKVYYVKVRAYKSAGRTKLYGAYSKVKKVRVK